MGGGKASAFKFLRGEGNPERPTKRRKTTAQSAPEDDLPTPQVQASAPSATALSTRIIPSSHIPSLTTFCIRVFAENLQTLSSNESTWTGVRSDLKNLPEQMIPRIFAALRATCPSILTNGFVVAHLLRGLSISFGGHLPGANRNTIAAVRESPSNAHLLELELSDFGKEPDSLFASVILKLNSLQVLVLRGCTKVGEKTAHAIAKSCMQLKVLNLNYTSVLPIQLETLLRNCTRLEVLKVAGVSNWTDAATAKLLTALNAQPPVQLTSLLSLKLRQTPLGNNPVSSLLSLCPNVKRLDLSFTLIRAPSRMLEGKSLEKLCLTSTKLTSNELLAAVAGHPDLRTLNIAAIGGGQGSSAAISNSSAMTMTDKTLHELTDILEEYAHLERVNLVGNAKLGITGRRDTAIGDFIRRVGRKCKALNLASIPSLRSSDLAGLLQDSIDQEPSRLRVLILNNTAVGDEAAPFIASCPSLETLAVGGTKFTSAGLFPIIDACPYLQKLDLTSCRGVKIGDRRRFFEVWEEEWNNN